MKTKFTGPGPKPSKAGIIKFTEQPMMADSTSYLRNDPRLMSDPDLLYGRKAFERDPRLQRVTMGNTFDGQTNQLMTGYIPVGPTSEVPVGNPNPDMSGFTYASYVNKPPVMQQRKMGGRLSKFAKKC